MFFICLFLVVIDIYRFFIFLGNGFGIIGFRYIEEG